MQKRHHHLLLCFYNNHTKDTIFCHAPMTTMLLRRKKICQDLQRRFHDWMVCVCSQAVWNFQKTTLFEYMPPEKLCFAGRVGKTSLVLRYVENVFSDKQVATVQASYLTKRLTVDGQSVTLSIWVRFHTYPSHAFMFLGSSSRYWW
jgi:hypothetical protein